MYEESDEILSNEIFEDIFYHDLESWHTVSSFLCDSCVENFKNDLKGIVVYDKSFQENAMSLDDLYLGSKNLRSGYTLSEYQKHVKNIACPNCGCYLSCNIWPYELPEGIIEHIGDIDEIAEISKKAPFMILEHPFAKEIVATLKKIYEDTSETLIKEYLYRCRSLKDREQPYSTEDSGVVPDYLAKEGRFNHTGYGFLYAATTKQLAFLEVVPNHKIRASMATIRILKELKILDITDLFSHDTNIYRAILASSLLVNPPGGNGWNKPGYIFTRFIADCAIYLGFDGIKYKSNISPHGSNLVIFRDKTNDLNWVIIYKIDKIEIYRYDDPNIYDNDAS